MNPREYPALKAIGKVRITKPNPQKVTIDVDRAEKEEHDPHASYVETLRAEIADHQAEIDARNILIADILAAH